MTDNPRTSMPFPAAFLDRDGTLIEDRDYLGEADGVVLLPGAAEAVRRLTQANVPVVIVTNQSGIARGLITREQYDAVERRTHEALAAEGGRVLSAYMCPHHPDFDGDCECRKPGTLLYRQAAAEHDLDLARSFYIGDRWRDVAPALAFGGHGILVPSPSTPDQDRERARREADVARTLGEAVERVLREAGGG